VDHPPAEADRHEGDDQPGDVVDREVPAQVDGGEHGPDQEDGQDARRTPQAVVAGHQEGRRGHGHVQARERRDLREGVGRVRVGEEVVALGEVAGLRGLDHRARQPAEVAGRGVERTQ